MIRISPSILSTDFSKLGEKIISVDKTGASFIHIDIMDGNLVPNISIGLPVIKSIGNKASKILDVHLMIENPSRYINDFVNADTDIITIHYEAEKHIGGAIEYVESRSIRAGISLNPRTPTFVSKDIISKLDLALIISVNPGFGGQKFIPYTLDKIKEVKEMSLDSNRDLLMGADGGVGKANAKTIIEAGTNVLVAGSAIFGNGDLEESIEAIGGE